jgi:FkbM family methyltransferase
MLRTLIHALPRGRARAARAIRHFRRAPFVDVVEPRALGVRLWIDPADPFQLEAWAGAYQQHVVQWIGDTIRPGATVLCLGLHVGYIAALARRLAGPRGRVLSAEPDPVARSIAERNLALGDARDAPIDIFPGGLSDASGELLLYHSHVPGHSSFAAPHQLAGRFAVPLATGDAWLAECGVTRLDVVVLDVEGWETHVLRGLRSTLARSDTVALCYEATAWALESAGASTQVLHEMVRDYGLTPTRLGGDDWVAVRPR